MVICLLFLMRIHNNIFSPIWFLISMALNNNLKNPWNWIKSHLVCVFSAILTISEYLCNPYGCLGGVLIFTQHVCGESTAQSFRALEKDATFGLPTLRACHIGGVIEHHSCISAFFHSLRFQGKTWEEGVGPSDVSGKVHRKVTCWTAALRVLHWACSPSWPGARIGSWN